METDDQATVRMQQQKDIASVRLEMKNRAACIASATLAAGNKIIKSTIGTLIEEISDKDGKRQKMSSRFGRSVKSGNERNSTIPTASIVRCGLNSKKTTRTK